MKKIRNLQAQVDNLQRQIDGSRAFLNVKIDSEHNRISVLAPKVDLLDSNVRKFTEFFNSELQESRKQDEVLGNIMRVLKQSGIIEEAVTGDNIFQVTNTVDRLQRNPLYKINKVVTK